MKMVTLQQASGILNISVMTLRRKIYARSIPYTRCNTEKTGKILLDISLVEQVLRNESIANLKNSKGFEADQEIDSSFDPEEEAPPSMANVHRYFGKVTQEDVDQGRFGADTFVCHPTDEEATSETFRISKSKR